jgi:hypothetical protein
MRDIIFRGKSIHPKRNGKWLYGQLLVVNYDGNESYHIWEGDIEALMEGEAADDWNCVHPETVGQFTNKKDRVNKDIYEGDKIEISGVNGLIVTWGKNGWVAAYKNGGVWSSLSYACESYSGDRTRPIREKAKVIGNIHDNN